MMDFEKSILDHLNGAQKNRRKPHSRAFVDFSGSWER